MSRAARVNVAVAANAEKWIFHHPSDRPLNFAAVALPAHPKLATELVREWVDDDSNRHQLHATVWRL